MRKELKIIGVQDRQKMIIDIVITFLKIVVMMRARKLKRVLKVEVQERKILD